MTKTEKILDRINPKLKELVEERIKEQDPSANIDTIIRLAKKNGRPERFIGFAFMWHQTKEGMLYWDEVEKSFIS